MAVRTKIETVTKSSVRVNPFINQILPPNELSPNRAKRGGMIALVLFLRYSQKSARKFRNVIFVFSGICCHKIYIWIVFLYLFIHSRITSEYQRLLENALCGDYKIIGLEKPYSLSR